MTIAQAEGVDEIEERTGLEDFFKDGQLVWLNISHILFVIGFLTRMNKKPFDVAWFEVAFLFSFSAPL